MDRYDDPGGYLMNGGVVAAVMKRRSRWRSVQMQIDDNNFITLFYVISCCIPELYK